MRYEVLWCWLQATSKIKKIFGTFLFLVLSTWNGSICLFSTSYATASESMTADLVSLLRTLGILSMISGYFVVLSSEFLLYMWTFPSSNRWIYAKYAYFSLYVIKLRNNQSWPVRLNNHVQSNVGYFSSQLWKDDNTCALSPSYLNSHVKSDLSNLWNTSLTPFVGWASIGFRGIPKLLESNGPNVYHVAT